jgi:hypothetical protein
MTEIVNRKLLIDDTPRLENVFILSWHSGRGFLFINLKNKGDKIMGGGSYTDKDWSKFSTSRGYHDPKTTVDDIYKKTGLDADLDPKNFTVRESVDGDDNPESTPIIIGLDVTGSMSPVLESMARKGLKTICEEIYKRNPVTNPHICTLGIGDMACDRAPFQATQFEADIRIFEQLEKLFLEGGGGGNDHESYTLAWYFARYRTKTDSFSKRGRKGFIFTIGDEEITPVLKADLLRHFMGGEDNKGISCQEMFDITFPEWNIFHIIIKEGWHASSYYNEVKSSWEKVIGTQRVLPLDDHTKAGEVIVSTMEVASGKAIDEVVNSWNGDTSVVVGSAIRSLNLESGYSPQGLDSYL